MKQQKLQGSAKRFLAMMTAFAMTLALVLEAMPTSAKAASTQGVREVDNFTDLYYALGLSGNCEIKLTKNIEERWSDKLTKKYVFEVHGEKILNLNGHDIIMHDEYRSVGVGDSREHTMFNIFEDGSLLIYDGTSYELEKQGKVFYDGYIYWDEDAIPVVRDLFKVSGSLTINGGRYQAGRSKEVWHNGGDNWDNGVHITSGYAYALVYGSAVKVTEGGSFVMNGGSLDTYLGRTDYGANNIDLEGAGRDWACLSAIKVDQGGHILINSGTVEGFGPGKLISLKGGDAANAKVITAGTFITGDAYLERFEQGAMQQAYFYSSPATRLGFTSANLRGNSYNFYGSFDEEGSDMLIVPGKRSSTLTVEGAEAITSDKTGETYYMMNNLNAVVRVGGVTPYFTEGLTGPGLDYHGKIVWTLINAETKEILDEIETSFNQTEIRMYDFVDYTSEFRAGELYYVECKAVEQLGDAKAESQSNRVQVATQRADYTVYGGVALTKANFPDQNFLNYLKQFDLDGNEFLSSTEITKITKLNLIGSNDWQVSDLTGLRYLWNVRTIWASGNANLSSFNGTNLPYLTELDLEGCPISSINLKDNHYLRYLNLDYIYDGGLTSLDVSNCPLLSELYLRRSQVTKLDISKNPSLVEAVLYGNRSTPENYYNSYGYEEFQLNEDGKKKFLSYPLLSEDALYVAKLKDAVPDANFRGYFPTLIDWNKDGLLSDKEAKGVTTLLCEDGGIKSLKGIELLPNLERLEAPCNDVTSVDFSRNLKLKDLDITENKISSLDVSKLTELTELAVGGNPITELDLTKNQELKSIRATACGLEKLYIAGLTKLTSIDVYKNKLTSLCLNDCTRLVALDISNNQLGALDVSSNAALKDLRVENNQLLSQLDLTYNTGLEYLSCYGTQISTVNIRYCGSLKTVFGANLRSDRTDGNTNQSYVAYRKMGSADHVSNDRLCVSDNQFIYTGEDIPLRIIDMSVTTSVYDREIAKFSIDAVGRGITYQWYVSGGGQADSDFVKTDCTSAVYTFVADQASYPAGMLVKCVVSDTDLYGNTRTRESNKCAMTIKTAPIKIVAQPQDYVGAIGSTAEFSIGTQLTQGTTAHYEWVYRDKEDGTHGFTDESASTPFLSVKMTKELVGCTVYCRVWDGNGYSVNSVEASFIDNGEPLDDPNLQITKKSITLFDTIVIDFKIPESSLTDYHGTYLMVTQNGETSKLTDYRTEGGFLIFSYRVAPHMIREDATAVPYSLDENDVTVKGEAFTYSVAQYCYNMLGKEAYQDAKYATLRRLLVDILRYGDAAQMYTGHKTTELASKDLTPAQQAMGTDVSVKMTYESVKEKEFATVNASDALASIEAATLYLEAAVNIQFKYVANNLTGLRVVVTGDPAGTEVLGEYAANANQIDNKGRYFVTFGNLNAGEMKKTVYATVMQGNKKVSNTYRYSIESYAASMKTEEGTTLLDKLLDAMMRYGNTAADYKAGR